MSTKYKKGYSLAEVVVATSIFSIIFLLVANFGRDIFSFNSNMQGNLSAQTDGRRILKTIVKELRDASPSNMGAYPIISASSSTITFYSNIDGDGYKEQIRYFLQGSDLKKGVIKPSGNPPTYNPANEQIYIMMRDVNMGTSPAFEYFDNSYTGSSAPLSLPVNVASIRLVKISIIIEKDPNKLPNSIVVSSQVTLRNLKDNL